MQHLFETYKPHYVYNAADHEHVPLLESSAAEARKTNVLGTQKITTPFVKHRIKNYAKSNSCWHLTIQ